MRNRLHFYGAVLGAACLVWLVACGEKPPKKVVSETKTETAAPVKPKPKPLPKIQDSEEGSLKVQIPSSEQKEAAPVVKTDETDVVVLSADDPGAEKMDPAMSRKEEAARKALRTKQPENSLAAQLAPLNDGKLIRWSPKWFPGGTGGVRLAAWGISRDNSIIAFVETLGEEQGPFSSRLVLYDTHSWSILLVHHLLKQDVRSIAFTKDHFLVALCRGQEALKTPDELLVIRLRDGRPMARVVVPDAEKLYVDSLDRFFVTRRETSKDARKVLVLENVFSEKPSEQKQKQKEMESVNASPVVAFSGDGERIVFAGDKALEIFKSSDLRPLSSILLPEKFVTHSALTVGAEAVILAPRKENLCDALRIQYGQVKAFGEPSGGVLALPLPSDSLFYAVMNRKGKVALVVLSTLQEKESFFPEALAPRTIGNPIALFPVPHAKCLPILDAGGSFYLIYKDPSGKRFRKELLFSAVRD